MEGYAERAVYARILVLPPRNFLHPDEILKFAYPFCNSSILKSFTAYSFKSEPLVIFRGYWAMLGGAIKG